MWGMAGRGMPNAGMFAFDPLLCNMHHVNDGMSTQKMHQITTNRNAAGTYTPEDILITPSLLPLAHSCIRAASSTHGAVVHIEA